MPYGRAGLIRWHGPFLGSLDEAERNPGSAQDTPDSAPLHPGYMGESFLEIA
ncbi:MAG: hypothetical protein HOP18_04905 [Deltaproteobacteria bacterium]|nr:hypothetical protein [Deltaproteobacteria bacterium]